MLVKAQKPLSDPTIYPKRDFEVIDDSVLNTNSTNSNNSQWIKTSGSAAKINSNWNMSVTKAKQKALRNLAEELAVKTSVEVYSENDVSRRHYNFSTVYAFQRVKTVQRAFEVDSFRVQLAIDPEEIKMSINE